MIQQNRLVEEFISLVKVDSETRFEQEICVVLKEKFSRLGLHVVEDNSMEKSGHGSGNLICTLEATDSNAAIPTIFFTSHMDTVAPGKGIKPQIGDDGYIRSDGTTILGSDDKAGIAAMIEGIQVLKEQNIPHGRIQFVITAGEESGLKGARAMDRSVMEAEFGFALDSNGSIGDIATAAPGRAEIEIIFHGKSAHAGVNPEDGISAIQVASKAVSRMSLGRIDSETTANIGSFSGVGPLNVVCDKVKMEAEARSIVQHKLEAQIAAMKEACESAAADAGTTCEFNADIVYASYMHDDSAPIVQLTSRALSTLGLTARTFHSGGGSDANIFNGMGIPTVNLAVGYHEIHTTKEHIAISDLVKTAELLVALVKEAAKV
ncbi:M20/M25/M40 family metallo-hydrolase [Paenibacillus alginolyticus]|uniref:M20/M25/M40 family metallo-hydrolase n=1 Tax=Paenibacillus alginolyticus TaxID=59839 RepID=A0ABT4GD44_9BACL|nr:MULTISPECIES: M20/M25/M40 family metallo-hydrolase [Paenibacillus]MCY9664794.1 M20/M25/M40 family metallo-hydrolase [Paenibacillus alginolyticus]MCY9694112.1 M20/M25/M40 family metallo-hydrolase [Paenibacillus alginolyticus]MEC0143570.1 M20/M25/M40 family metallo-hydrolase [Paenibacillus alginolyticus]NRF89623.1 M20/M25/M40 family metallo-hydrolase [Paenibacillus frigoriresistens]